jgi:transposase
VADFKDHSRKEDVCEFFALVRENNPEYTIVMILDNFPSHRSNMAISKAKELDIIPIFLPPYSPKLNPIEYIWKSIKMEVSTYFVPDLEEFRNFIRYYFNKFSKSLSYAKGWIEKFGSLWVKSIIS